MQDRIHPFEGWNDTVEVRDVGLRARYPRHVTAVQGAQFVCLAEPGQRHLSNPAAGAGDKYFFLIHCHFRLSDGV